MTDGILSRTRSYLVGHMEYSEGRGWREKVKKELIAMGITVFDPYCKPFLNEIPEDELTRRALYNDMKVGNYDTVATRMKQVRSDDLRCCDVSDFCFAKIKPNIASWGTGEELVTFVKMKKPIFLVVDGGKKKTPLWVMGMLPHKYIYNSIGDALAMLKKINSGEVEIDSTRWRLLKPELR